MEPSPFADCFHTRLVTQQASSIVCRLSRTGLHSVLAVDWPYRLVYTAIYLQRLCAFVSAPVRYILAMVGSSSRCASAKGVGHEDSTLSMTQAFLCSAPPACRCFKTLEPHLSCTSATQQVVTSPAHTDHCSLKSHPLGVTAPQSSIHAVCQQAWGVGGCTMHLLLPPEPSCSSYNLGPIPSPYMRKILYYLSFCVMP
ncbi:hypothetical protein P154DRAFT_295399 [Amniculicola lignicola CBS 123094]|uniref:Uncharacterized protein n=1 Tax=Amniculicola lignicola CBS 123094 TaxID=1392246 RepID=A0A6A5W5T7_9PLEO|nr:hypothetical protein P154DRAFT_295399 [Amniculicola lignicola CBS 123094]